MQYEDFLGFRDSLVDYAASLLSSRDDAEDMVQDLYVKLWNRRDSLSEIESPKSYCNSVIKRQCLDRLKSAENRNGTQMPADLAEEQPGIEERLALKEQLAATMAEVEKLPEGQKSVLVKKALDGCSYEDITAQTGISEQNARTQMSLARRTLRRRMAWAFAAAAVAVGVFIWALAPQQRETELVDTFESPELAYAQMEKSLRMISDRMEKGEDLARKSGAQLHKVGKVFDNK